MTQATNKQTLTAIVTGASTGLGFAITKRFLSEDINVVMNARTAADLEAAYEAFGSPSNATFLVGDIANKSTGVDLVRAAETEFGGLDILVNNAGVFGAKPFLDTEESDIDRFYAINFKGAYFAAQAAVPVLQKRGGGAIVNIGTTLLEHAIAGFPASACIFHAFRSLIPRDRGHSFHGMPVTESTPWRPSSERSDAGRLNLNRCCWLRSS